MKLLKCLSIPFLGLIFGYLLTSSSVFAATSFTCTWTGGGSNNNFSNATNWSNCNGSYPQPNDDDSLVFNDINTNTIANNDITNLQLDNITFSGNYLGDINLAGNNFSLSGGIIDNANGLNLSNIISTNIYLNANQDFNISSSNDFLTFSGTLNVSNYSLTFDANSQNSFIFNSSFIGNGALIFSGEGNFVNLNVPSSEYAGTTIIENGSIVNVSDPSLDGLGSGLITVSDGGAVELSSTSTDISFPNKLDISGSGNPNSGSYGAVLSCLGELSGIGCTASNTILSLAGSVTLSSDSILANAVHKVSQSDNYIATFNIGCNNTFNGYSLSVPSEYDTQIKYATCNDVSVVPVITTSGNIPSAPDTGFGVKYLDPENILVLSILVGCTLLTLSWYINKKLFLNRKN